MSSSSKSKGTPKMDQIIGGVAAVNISEDGGPWEVSMRKSKNKTSEKSWGRQPAARDNYGKAPAAANPWPQIGSAGRGNIRPQLPLGRAFPIKSATSQTSISAPLGRGWNWNSRPGASTNYRHVEREPVEEDEEDEEINNDDNDDDDDDDDLNDDELLSDEFDSDASEASFETRKKNKWFKVFFSKLDDLSVEQINDVKRQWHCPACQNGPGAIDWYHGLRPLISHAKTKGSKRVKLHREFAELLDEELRQKGTSVVPAGEAFGKWKFPSEVVRRQIVWPPMVVIMNTKLERDENDIWKGMGSQELRDLFSVHGEVKARHSYGPQGHRGMSMLIFESSAVAYFEAECLSERFKEQGTDREAWDNPGRVIFSAGGDRKLYGFLAEKQDLDIFNRHSKGKSRLKFEMRSYQEVVSQLRKIAEDNELLIWCKDEWAKDKKLLKEIKESYAVLSGLHRRVSEERHFLREKYRVHDEQKNQAMDFQEDFFKNQLNNAFKNAKEDSFQRLQQEARQKRKQTNATSDDGKMEEFGGERDNLVKIHEEEIAEMKQRYYKELVELGNKFDAQMNLLRSNFAPPYSR